MTLSPKLKVGLIGLGAMGNNHRRALQASALVDEVVLFDSMRKVEPQFDNEFAVESLESVAASVDCVIVATPTFTHLSLTEFFLQQNIHCLIEKPLSDTSANAHRLKKLSTDVKCIATVGHVERFNPTVTTLSKILKTHEVRNVTFNRLSLVTDRSNDISVVADLMIHDIDLMLQLSSQAPRLISAYGLYNEASLDYAVAIFKTADIAFVLTASRMSHTKARTITVDTDSAFIVADLLTSKITLQEDYNNEYYSEDANLAYRENSRLSNVVVPRTEALVDEQNSFFTAILGRSALTVTLQDGVDAISVVEQIEAVIREDSSFC